MILDLAEKIMRNGCLMRRNTLSFNPQPTFAKVQGEARDIDSKGNKAKGGASVKKGSTRIGGGNLIRCSSNTLEASSQCMKKRRRYVEKMKTKEEKDPNQKLEWKP